MTAAAQLWTPFGQAPANDNRAPRNLDARVNEHLPLIVALSGVAGSGKSTAAQYLVDIHGYTRVRFAGPLKAMCRALGLDDRHIEGEWKEEPCRLLNGRTPRYAMQTLGTDWGRKCMGDDFWVHMWSFNADNVLRDGGRVVVDDCRFPNEAATVRKMGGDIYRIIGRGGIAGGHESERLDFIPDVVIDNAGTVEELRSRVDQALVRWG